MKNAMLDTGDDHAGFDGTPGRNKEPRWDEKIKWWNFPDDGEPYLYRLIGRPMFFFNHWVKMKKKDGTAGKSLAVLCKNFNSVTGKSEENGCKICEYYRSAGQVYAKGKVDYDKWHPSLKGMGARSTMGMNAIVRDLQQQGPPGNQKDWTFVHPIKVPKGVSETIVDLAKKYNKKPGATKPEDYFGFNHAQYGKDLNISYNSQADASKMYSIIPGDRTPLTEEELAHAPYMVDIASHVKFMEDAKVEELLQRNGYYELLQSLQADFALKDAQARVGITQQSPAATDIPKTNQTNTAPKVEQQAATSSIPSAMDVEDDGGIPAGTEDHLPVANSATTESATAATPAASPLAAESKPAAANGGEDKIQAFASTHGKTLVENTKDYSDLSLRTVTVGTKVPDCFSKISETRKNSPEVCKACPIKLDCMQVEV